MTALGLVMKTLGLDLKINHWIPTVSTVPA